MTRHFSVKRFCARLFLFRHTINDSLIIIIIPYCYFFVTALVTICFSNNNYSDCVLTENLSLSSRAAVRCIRIPPFFMEGSSTDSNDRASEHVSKIFVLWMLLSKLIIMIIIFSFNIQTDRLQNDYKYSVNWWSQVLQESNLTVWQ